MLEFKKLEKDLKILEKYFSEDAPYFCDLTIGTRYIWRDEFIIEYAEFDDTLLLKESGDGFEDGFYFPVGKNPLGALVELENYTLKNFIPLNFCCLRESELEFLKKRYYISEDYFERDWSDYVYSAETFKTYAGKKLSAKRNHVNKFKKLYEDYTVEEFSSLNTGEVISFLDDYIKSGKEISDFEKEEIEKLVDYVENAANLNQVGVLLKVNGKVVGISFGEKNKNTLTVHVEKANTSYDGVYPTLAKEFALLYATDEVLYINREEDCGDEGLRTSKMRYKPLEIRHKYVLKVKTLFDRISPFCAIDLQDIKIEDFKEEFKEDFFRLSSNDELNKLWGYDYREDLDEELTKDYFLKFVEKMKRKKEEYSFAVTESGKLAGELVLHSFDYFGGVEMGFRFLKEYQKKGYAIRSATALKEFVKTTLNAKTLKSRCFKENVASFNLITRLGLEKTSEDLTHYYFSVNFI